MPLDDPRDWPGGVVLEPANWIVLALALPFLAALVVAPAERRLRGSGGLLTAGAGGAAFALLLAAWGLGGTVEVRVPWIPSAGIAFLLRLDALSLLFATLVTGVGAVILVYAQRSMVREGDTPRFYAYMALFMGAMLGLVLAGDLILLFLFWELTTLSSFLLIGFRREEQRSVASAMKALLITGLGGLALLVSFLLMQAASGSFEVQAVLAGRGALADSGLLAPVLMLFAVAVAAKSAQFPLHVWLPDAMVAPTPVSAYLHSAAMVKAGIYLLARFLPALTSTGWEVLFLPLGTVTMVLGGLQAIRATDLKRILAYSTISQLGLMASAFGTASVTGQEAGLLHLLNHALFKSALFLVAGAVTLATGVTNVRRLGGLGRHMPLTAAACGLAALSMAGIPPLGGFLSKETYYEALLEGGQAWALGLAVVGGALTFAYSLHFFGRVFLGRGRRWEARESLALAVPALLLAGGSLLLGLFPSVATGLLSTAAHASGEGFDVGLLQLNPATVSLTLAAAAGGLLLLWRYQTVATWLEGAIGRLRRTTPDAAYEGLVARSQPVAQRIGLLLQNGSLRRYAGLLLLFVLGVLLWRLPPLALEFPTLETSKDLVLAIILLAMMAFAGLAASLRNLLHAVLSLSGMGFLLATAFMLLNAPDLAMTQILVEMVLLIVFLVVIARIPFRAIRPSLPRRLPDVLLSLALVVGVAGLVSLSLAAFADSVATFFLQTPVELTGGRNVVNVVVTDFRAFDTLGEVTVVGLSALAVYTLLRRWKE